MDLSFIKTFVQPVAGGVGPFQKIDKQPDMKCDFTGPYYTKTQNGYKYTDKIVPVQAEYFRPKINQLSL